MPDPLLTPGDPLLVAAPVEWREACISMPAMRALKRMGIMVRVLCPQRQAELWVASGFAEAETYPDKASARQIAGTLENEVAALAWEAGEAADAFVKAGIKRRLGPSLKGLEKRLTESLAVIEAAGPIQHRVRFYLGLVEKLGAETMVAENFAPIAVEVPRAVDRILLVPDSDFGSHYGWLPERWEALAKELSGQGKALRIARRGRLGEALAKAMPEVESVGLELPGLEELASHGLCIAADGSVPHLAAHVGTRCIVLFGPGEPEWMRPLGKQHLIARRKVECSPCFASKCVMDLRCQNDLEVAEVLRVVGCAG
jgi:ADP-heptose:LPS heptosyltransferase